MAGAEPPSVSIIYPETQAPFKVVYDEILSGIEAHLKFTPPSLRIGTTDDGNIKNWLAQQNSKVVITLGSKSFEAVQKTAPFSFSMVVGAVLFPQTGQNIVPKESVITISYAPSPKLLFQRLKKLFPTVQHIHVVYNADLNDWLIQEARKASEENALKLDTHAGQDLKAGAEQYEKILEMMQPAQNALWILQDSKTFNEEAMLPDILKKAWDKKLIVFSSSLVHVRKGILFALYPDNRKLGERLGHISQEVLEQKYTGNRLMPLMDTKAALNTRTADHLGLKVTRGLIEEFDLTFPPQG